MSGSGALRRELRGRQRALEIQQATGQHLGETLVAIGAVWSEDLTRVLADHLQVPFVDLRTNAADPDVVRLLPQQVARTYQALAVARLGQRIVVAMAKPNDPVAVDVLQSILGNVTLAIADPAQLRKAIETAYPEHEARVVFTCPGCGEANVLRARPWVMHDEAREPSRYYLWDRDPAAHRPVHVCRGHIANDEVPDPARNHQF